jgi:integrase
MRSGLLPAIFFLATLCTAAGRRGPVPKRRYQKGTFRVENGFYYAFFYTDQKTPDGSTKTSKERFNLGKVGEISERAAQREFDVLRQQINKDRGSVRPTPRGETFKDAVKLYTDCILPNLCCSTIRQRTSHLRAHLIPRFGPEPLMALDIQAIQRFVTDMALKGKKHKTILNVAGTLFEILKYGEKCKMRVPETKLKDIVVKGDRGETEMTYINEETARTLLNKGVLDAKYRLMFVLAWCLGLRAAEILGLRITDLDFNNNLITPSKQADDRTRKLRDLKTRSSRAPIPFNSEIRGIIEQYLNHWKQNPQRLLFPNRYNRPMKRAYAVKFGLLPALRKLGMPTKGVGFHAFRHGLGTALANSKVSPKTVQQILRHSDIKTTFRYYVHSDMDAQRAALETVQVKITAPDSSELHVHIPNSKKNELLITGPGTSQLEIRGSGLLCDVITCSEQPVQKHN